MVMIVLILLYYIIITIVVTIVATWFCFHCHGNDSNLLSYHGNHCWLTIVIIATIVTIII